jgi:hypothetical protein
METVAGNRVWHWLVTCPMVVASGDVLAAGETTPETDAAVLEKGFLAPPPSGRPWVYWFWLSPGGRCGKMGAERARVGPRLSANGRRRTALSRDGVLQGNFKACCLGEASR